jgi:hypothetical protein
MGADAAVFCGDGGTSAERVLKLALPVDFGNPFSLNWLEFRSEKIFGTRPDCLGP